MAIYAITDSGKTYKSDSLIQADYFLKLREQKPVWEVIEEIVKWWILGNPKEWKSYLIRHKDIKEIQKVTTVGSKQFRGVSKDKKHDAYLSLLIDFPLPIMLMIRKLYNPQELVFDKKFFTQFAVRFQQFV